MIPRSLEPTLSPSEPAYRAHFLKADAAQIKAAVLVVLALVAAAMVAERTLADQPPLAVFLATRVFMVVLSAGTLVGLSRARTAAVLDWVTLIWMLGVVAQYLVLVAKRPASTLDGIGLVAIIIGLYMLIPTPLAARVSAAALATIGFVLLSWLVRHEDRLSFYALYIFAALALHSISSWASTRMYTQRRQLYAAQNTLQASIRERDALIHQLRQFRQMASLGRLAAGVAHDFNNVLNTMLVPVDLIEGGDHAASEQQNELQIVRDAVSRGKELTQQLLAFSRQEPVAPQVVSLNELIDDTYRLLARTLSGSVRIDLALAHDLARVRVDPGQVRQILMNLAINARDAMHGHGTASISTRNETVSTDAAGANVDVPPGRYAVLSVADNGVGMDADTLKQIFEPFFTTKPKGEGTGLGLAIVYGVVEQSGGFIHVSSEVGKGTTFEVFFPALFD